MPPLGENADAPISPWHWETVQLRSPDGTYLATLADPSEFAMGGPTSGELKVSNGQSAFDCNPSMVWSNDSRFLAVPQWSDRLQRLLLIDTVSRKRAVAPATYRVLALHAFRDGIVRGIDSPKHEPLEVAFDVRALFPDAFDP